MLATGSFLTTPNQPQALRSLLIKARDEMARQAWPQARKLLERAVVPLSGVAEVWLALAEVRQQLGDSAGCVVAAQRALALEPRSLDACLLAGTGLMRLHRPADAVRVFESFAPELAAGCVDFHVPHGEALRLVGRPQESVNVLMKALALKIDDLRAHMQLGFAFRELRLDVEAAECFRTVTALNPHSLPGHAYMAHWDQFSCHWQNFDDNRRSLLSAVHHAAQNPDQALEFSAPFTLVAIPHHPLDMLEAARLSARYLARGARPLPPSTARRPHGKIRVGYLSSDFYNHATSLLLVEVLERRDRERFEVVLFSHGKDDGSPMRRRIAQACEQFVDVREMSQADTARAIRDASIDILVDLKGYTGDTRLASLAFRPAPLQVSWLGFPGTSGADYVDYIIGDPIVTPMEHAPWYSEHIAQMPVSYQPNDSRRARPGTVDRTRWGLPDGAIVLASFNQPYKITPEVFDVWMDILKRVDGAVIWQLLSGDQARANLRAEAARRGIDPARLVFAPAVGPEDHLMRIPAADIALDSWPCNGHTTTSDALWSGVPVVAMEGLTFASRVASSLLQAVGAGELVCHERQAYADLVVALAQDAPRRAAIRERLEQARDTSPLFDAARFAGDLEALYARMWARHSAGLTPAALPAQVG